MYNKELEAISVPLSDLLLDPNNPRFWAEKQGPEIPQDKIPEERVQAAARRRSSASKSTA